MTEQQKRYSHRWPLITVAAAVVVMLVVGAVGWVRAVQLHHDSPASNAAMVDSSRTAGVIADVSKTLTSVLSYDYSNPAPTEAAATRSLTGAARKEHKTLFAELKKKAPGQNLVLSAQVQAAGVTDLSERKATLLVFLDQSSQRASDKQTSVSAAELVVKVVRVDGQWKIDGLKPL